MKQQTNDAYFTVPSRVFTVVTFIDGDGELCQHVFDDEEIDADELIEELKEIKARYCVANFHIN